MDLHQKLVFALLAALLATSSVIVRPTAASSSPQLVLFDHDGGVDDFITLLLLLANPEKVKLIGITVLDGDCFAAIAVNTTLKILHVLGQHDIPVAVSTLQAVHPFPDAYRAQGSILDVLPMLNHDTLEPQQLRRQLWQQPGQDVFAQLLLQQADNSVTIVATGPLSNLAYALTKYPKVLDKVAHVWWMGGALRVPGNVRQPHTDGSAEWNAFWDPPAVAVVWNSSLPLTLVPLDATNKVPITPDLVYRFGPQAHYLLSALAGTFYAPVITWVHVASDSPYYAWDVLTATCMLEPSLCQVTQDVQVVAVVSGPSQGATVLVEQHQGWQASTLTAPGTWLTDAPPAPEVTSHPRAELRRLREVDGIQTGQEQVEGPHHNSHMSLEGVGSVNTGMHNQHTSRRSDYSSGIGHDAATLSVRGTDIAKHLSRVKTVSAVMSVDATGFHTFLLSALRL